MSKIYEILNDQNEVVNRIVASEWFVEKYYPDRYRLADDQPDDPETEQGGL